MEPQDETKVPFSVLFIKSLILQWLDNDTWEFKSIQWNNQKVVFILIHHGFDFQGYGDSSLHSLEHQLIYIMPNLKVKIEKLLTKKYSLTLSFDAI